mgnify:CR=1 FL=1
MKTSANRKGTKSQRTIGTNWEDVAVKFLQQKGFEIIERNFYYNHGEIDVIAKEKDELVFIEVKFRRNEKFGSAEESVTPKKQELLRRTAEGYVLKNNIENISCRFDVVAIHLENNKPNIIHHKNAFY